MSHDTPLFKLTVGEFIDLVNKQVEMRIDTKHEMKNKPEEKRYVYGLAGIASIFGCSKTQAHRIKASGKIDAAIKQTGRLIIVDAEKALNLAADKKKKRH